MHTWIVYPVREIVQVHDWQEIVAVGVYQLVQTKEKENRCGGAIAITLLNQQDAVVTVTGVVFLSERLESMRQRIPCNQRIYQRNVDNGKRRGHGIRKQEPKVQARCSQADQKEHAKSREAGEVEQYTIHDTGSS